MRRVRVEAPEAATDMTPIIDVVFNLIIFFMIASELNEQTVEQLRLPRADRAEPAARLDAGAARVLQANVLADGQVKVRGQPFALDPLPGRPSLGSFLELEAAGYDREPLEPGQTVAPSVLRVNVRADREAPFGRVQGVLDACMDHGIYRTSLAADPDPGAAGPP